MGEMEEEEHVGMEVDYVDPIDILSDFDKHHLPLDADFFNSFPDDFHGDDLDRISGWDHLGDIVVLPKTSFRDPLWDSIGDELWPLVAKSLGAQRLARQSRILPTGTRDSTLELLVGDNGWVTHHKNGILYSFDATRCMFSSGNRSEKLRMARLYCENETVVDLFAGIGYFMLPFLIKELPIMFALASYLRVSAAGLQL